MEWLILSDLHLNSKVKPSKLNFLLNLVGRYDNIIINGDLYEAKYTDPNKFINSGYKPLLDLFKAKNTIYLWGNHDPQKKGEIVAKYFAKKHLPYYKITLGNKKYHIEHGHRLSTPETEELGDKTSWFLDTVLGPIEKYCPPLVKYEGTKWNNRILRDRYIDGLIKPDEILICGHTHVKIYQLQNNYINTGSSKNGTGNYLVINETGCNLQGFKY